MSRTRVGNPKIPYEASKLVNLEYYRSRYGLTQANMADLLGVNLSTYNQKVNGKQTFKLDEMTIIHTFFNQKAKKSGESVLTLDKIFLQSELQ